MKNGEAYAFFHCNATKSDIDDDLPYLKGLSPGKDSFGHSNLELLLLEPAELEKSFFFTPIVEHAKKSGMNYILKANHLNLTNEKTAQKLFEVMKMIKDSWLCKPNDFKGHIVYKNIFGKYVLY